MSDGKSAKEKPVELFLLFLGMFIFFMVQIFVPEEVSDLRVGGFLLSALVIIASLTMMIIKRRKLNKSNT